ncbi:heterokaryon incompatibility protein-domain-containing protein [Ilyonectria sp. MPI-CAGE-AT-0026]|nr:heterokaryon incompatibility protein-domain-containing protein [Ilyonectria sp. MPI-CAGE-AT-0026]
MFLIDAKTLELKNFSGKPMPDDGYAILSHTWETEGEISMQEFRQRSADTKAKPGYAKIHKACEKALQYGIHHVWVDTCCIDKTSSAELSEAINSMFPWYEEALVCFAYLADVPPALGSPHDNFDTSRWFTRGWTLQELVAPQKLDFFANDWTLIANRHELASRISHITNIKEAHLVDATPAAQRNLLARTSVAEKMSWASKRETTRKEDTAYCLLGILGVNMPLIYGEGERAFLRLQEEVVRTSFDPTILAWDTLHNTRPLARQETRPSSSWLLAIKTLAGRDHPFRAGPHEPTSQVLMGLLATSPAYFAQCNDVMACDVALEWDFTAQGLRIILPVSEDEDPYVLLPCRLRHDPWTLLAVPVRQDANMVYSRCSAPVRTINHYAWHQWASQAILLKTKRQASSSLSDGSRGSLWIRSVPKTIERLHVYTPDGWRPYSISKDSQPDDALLRYPQGNETSALFLEAYDARDSYTVVITASKQHFGAGAGSPDDILSMNALSLRSLFFMLDGEKLDFRIIPGTSLDNVGDIHRQVFNPVYRLTTDTRVNGRTVSVKVIRRHHLDRILFEINIDKPSIHFNPRCPFPMYQSFEASVTTISKKAAVVWDICQFFDEFYLRWLRVLLETLLFTNLGGPWIARRLGEKIIRKHLMPEGSLYTSLETSLLQWDAIQMTHRLHVAAVMASYGSLVAPALSCLIPRWSSLLRRAQWAILCCFCILGVAAGPVVPWFWKFYWWYATMLGGITSHYRVAAGRTMTIQWYLTLCESFIQGLASAPTSQYAGPGEVFRQGKRAGMWCWLIGC